MRAKGEGLRSKVKGRRSKVKGRRTKDEGRRAKLTNTFVGCSQIYSFLYSLPYFTAFLGQYNWIMRSAKAERSLQILSLCYEGIFYDRSALAEFNKKKSKFLSDVIPYGPQQRLRHSRQASRTPG